jgi:hypothetical protein
MDTSMSDGNSASMIFEGSSVEDRPSLVWSRDATRERRRARVGIGMETSWVRIEEFRLVFAWVTRDVGKEVEGTMLDVRCSEALVPERARDDAVGAKIPPGLLERTVSLELIWKRSQFLPGSGTCKECNQMLKCDNEACEQ